jgi:short-subunit dehydrogenase
MNKQIVLVTGASSGIGMSIAKEFISKGFRVYGTTRYPEKISKVEAAEILFIPLDVTSALSRKTCIEYILNIEGRINILVNNAGYGQMGPLADITGDIMHKQLDINLVGPASFTQMIIPTMIMQKSGMIVNISSISGVMPSAFAGAYCASKAALNAWSDTLRMELKPFGIKVITVQPGAIQSNFGNTAANNLVFGKEKSFYAPIAEFINKRAMISQEGANTSEEFARRLVRQLIKKRPRSIVRIGKSSIIYPLLKRWLPTCLLDLIISRKFGLTKLRKLVNNDKYKESD